MLVALVTISVTISSPAVSVTLSHTFDVNQRSSKLTFCPLRSMGQWKTFKPLVGLELSLNNVSKMIFLFLYTRETASFLSTCNWKNSMVNSFTHLLWLMLIMFFQLPWNLMLKLEKNMLKIHQARGQDFTLPTPRREPCLLFSKKPRNLQEKCRTLLQRNWDLKGALLQTFLWMPEDGIQSSESQGTHLRFKWNQYSWQSP